MVVISNVFGSFINDIEYQIYDVLGKKILEGKLLDQEELVKMEDKSAGLYFVQIRNLLNGAFFTKKILISRN